MSQNPSFMEILQLIENSIVEQLDNNILQSVMESSEPVQEKDNKIMIDLPVKQITRSIEKLKPICSICLQDIEYRKRYYQLECKHFFHTKCLSEWVKYKKECPGCRHSIRTRTKRSHNPKTSSSNTHSSNTHSSNTNQQNEPQEIILNIPDNIMDSFITQLERNQVEENVQDHSMNIIFEIF